jgi:hypothetical protein
MAGDVVWISLSFLLEWEYPGVTDRLSLFVILYRQIHIV